MKKYWFTFDFDGDIITDSFYGENYDDVIYWVKLRYGDDCESYMIPTFDKE